MAVPKQHELHRPILEMVVTADGVVALAEVRARLIDQFALTDADLQESVPSGPKRFDNRVYWAVSYLRRAGLLLSPSQAKFVATPHGKDFLQSHSGPISNKTLNGLIYGDEQQAANPTEHHSNSTPAPDDSDPELSDLADFTPDEVMGKAFYQSRDKLIDDLLVRIQNESYAGFELMVLDLLREMGYGEPAHTGKSGDGGIDGIINQDALGLEKVYVQAKRWANQVGEPEIRNFSGSLDPFGATKGVFITTSTFSSTARQTAQTISAGSKLIRLVDGNELAQLMIRHGVGVVTEYTYEIKKLDENYFAEGI